MEEAMVTYGIPAEGDPDELLLAEVRMAAGQVAWVRSIIREMTPEELIWGPTQVSHQEGQSVEGPIDVTTTVDSARLSMWVDLELKKSAHFVKACDIAIRAGIQERLVRLAEQAGERQGRWLRACADEAGLTAEQVRVMMQAGARNMHLLEAG